MPLKNRCPGHGVSYPTRVGEGRPLVPLPATPPVPAPSGHPQTGEDTMVACPPTSPTWGMAQGTPVTRQARFRPYFGQPSVRPIIRPIGQPSSTGQPVHHPSNWTAIRRTGQPSGRWTAIIHPAVGQPSFAGQDSHSSNWTAIVSRPLDSHPSFVHWTAIRLSGRSASDSSPPNHTARVLQDSACTNSKRRGRFIQSAN